MVHFEGSEEDGSYLLLFPGGEQLQVTADDVGRSRLLRDLLDSAVEAGETTLTFPSCVELSHLRTWATAVQPDSVVLRENAETMGKCLVVRSHFTNPSVRGSVEQSCICGRLQGPPGGGTPISGLMQAVDFLADEGLMQKVLVAYAERLFPPAAAETDADFLRVRPLRCMHERCAMPMYAYDDTC